MKKTTSNLYANAFTLAEQLEELFHSEFWGSTEGITWEDREDTKASFAYAICTGYRYHQTVKEFLLRMVHEDASDYDAHGVEHQISALQYLDDLKLFEVSHDPYCQLHDCAQQIQNHFYSCNYSVTLDNILKSIETGKDYGRLVKSPLFAKEPEGPGEAAILNDLNDRLKLYECKHLPNTRGRHETERPADKPKAQGMCR